MTDPTANKDYISKQIEIAESTDSEAIKNDALYRAGTQLEAIECDGDNNLSNEQQESILDAALRFLGGKE